MSSMLIREVLFSQDKTWMNQKVFWKVTGSNQVKKPNQQGYGEQALLA